MDIENGFNELFKVYNHCSCCKAMKHGKFVKANCCERPVEVFVCNDCLNNEHLSDGLTHKGGDVK